MQIHNPPGGHPVPLRIWNTAQEMGRAFDACLAAEGSTRSHFFVLVALDRLESPSQHALAEVVGVDDATITSHLAAMQREGLVTRTRDLADRRVLRVSMSDAGRELWSRLTTAAEEYTDAQLAGLTPDELDAFVAVLSRLESNVRVMGAARVSE